MISLGGCLTHGRSCFQRTHRKVGALRLIEMLAVFGVMSFFAGAKTTEPPPSPKTVKVAAVQCSSIMGNVASNTRKVTKLVREAASNGARIVVLPELCITGYLSQDGRTNWQLPGWPIEDEYIGRSPVSLAQRVPGTTTRHFCQLAKELGIYLTIPFIEVDDNTGNPRYFNTVCLASPHGKVVAHYRKLEPWPHAEQSWATTGDRGLQTFDTEYGRVGLAVCFDIHNVVKKYRSHHLWALLYPTAWADGDYPAEWFYHILPGQVHDDFKHHIVAAIGAWIMHRNGEASASAKSFRAKEKSSPSRRASSVPKSSMPTCLSRSVLDELIGLGDFAQHHYTLGYDTFAN